ncbi:MAG: outer membrane protein assembly factor BamD [Desulfobacterales bacterium]
MKRRTLLIFVVVSLMSWALVGCGLFGSKGEKSAQELAADGVEAFERGKYRDALESFQQLKDWYPFSKFAILADLKIADSHYYLEEYLDAVFAYEEFENLHPRNEAIPYVIYQIGRCYFEQIDSIDRDQANTRKALESFSRLRQRFPENEYALRAQEHITECLKQLAGHDLYVGRFYFKQERYRAAKVRLERVINEYPDLGYNEEARELLKKSEAELAKAAD